jgi:hypothetical protein
MKTRILIVLLAVSFIKVNGQAVLEHSFPGEYINSSPVLLTTLGWVYPTIMYNSNITLKIYADDYTLLKSIYLSVPTGYQFLGIYNLSDHLFNSDDKIEILYLMYNNQIHAYDLLLVNESGELLQEFPRYNFAIIYEIDGLFKMYANDNEDSIGYIYTLPGTMLMTDNNTTNRMTASVFPNPCSSIAQIRYSLPEGTSNAWMEVFSSHGMAVLQKPVSDKGSEQIDVSSFAAGEYLYSIKTGNGFVAGGKFIKK